MVQPWFVALDEVKKHSFKITTPHGWGTGFLIANPEKGDICGVATAYHVVDHAHVWEEPTKLYHAGSSRGIVLRREDRIILTEPSVDVAVIVFKKKDLFIDNTLLSLVPPRFNLLVQHRFYNTLPA